jgi:hypothetical protein
MRYIGSRLIADQAVPQDAGGKNNMIQHQWSSTPAVVITSSATTQRVETIHHILSNCGIAARNSDGGCKCAVARHVLCVASKQHNLLL